MTGKANVGVRLGWRPVFVHADSRRSGASVCHGIEAPLSCCSCVRWATGRHWRWIDGVPFVFMGAIRYLHGSCFGNGEQPSKAVSLFDYDWPPPQILSPIRRVMASFRAILRRQFTRLSADELPEPINAIDAHCYWL